jgi:hypothetical protein
MATSRFFRVDNWSGTFTCPAPGLGRLLQWAIRSHIARLAAALAQAAES